MSGSPPWKVEVRRALAGDYDDLMAIGDVFDGVDYLGHFYTKYIHSPDMYCYVVTCDWKAVTMSVAIRSIRDCCCSVSSWRCIG